MSEREGVQATRHSYQSFSWRGSWPTYRCVACGCDSQSRAASEPCPGRCPVRPTEEARPAAIAKTTPAITAGDIAALATIIDYADGCERELSPKANPSGALVASRAALAKLRRLAGES